MSFKNALSALVCACCLCMNLSCSRHQWFGGHAADPQSMDVAYGLDCFKHLPNNVRRMFMGQLSDPQVAEAFNCVRTSVKGFLRHVKPSNPKGYALEDVYGVLRRHFPKIPESDYWMLEDFFRLKKTLVAGSSQFLSFEEANKMLQLLDSVQEGALELNQHKCVYVFGSAPGCSTAGALQLERARVALFAALNRMGAYLQKHMEPGEQMDVFALPLSYGMFDASLLASGPHSLTYGLNPKQARDKVFAEARAWQAKNTGASALKDHTTQEPLLLGEMRVFSERWRMGIQNWMRLVMALKSFAVGSVGSEVSGDQMPIFLKSLGEWFWLGVSFYHGVGREPALGVAEHLDHLNAWVLQLLHQWELAIKRQARVAPGAHITSLEKAALEKDAYVSYQQIAAVLEGVEDLLGTLPYSIGATSAMDVGVFLLENMFRQKDTLRTIERGQGGGLHLQSGVRLRHVQGLKSEWHAWYERQKFINSKRKQHSASVQMSDLNGVPGLVTLGQLRTYVAKSPVHVGGGGALAQLDFARSRVELSKEHANFDPDDWTRKNLFYTLTRLVMRSVGQPRSMPDDGANDGADDRGGENLLDPLPPDRSVTAAVDTWVLSRSAVQHFYNNIYAVGVDIGFMDEGACPSGGRVFEEIRTLSLSGGRGDGASVVQVADWLLLLYSGLALGARLHEDMQAHAQQRGLMTQGAHMLGVDRAVAQEYLKRYLEAYFYGFPGLLGYMRHLRSEGRAEDFVSAMIELGVEDAEDNEGCAEGSVCRGTLSYMSMVLHYLEVAFMQFGKADAQVLSAKDAWDLFDSRYEAMILYEGQKRFRQMREKHKGDKRRADEIIDGEIPLEDITAEESSSWGDWVVRLPISVVLKMFGEFDSLWAQLLFQRFMVKGDMPGVFGWIALYTKRIWGFKRAYDFSVDRAFVVKLIGNVKHSSANGSERRERPPGWLPKFQCTL